jgi:hypothetical protein
MKLEVFNALCIIWALLGVATFILLQFVTAPYGRHLKKGWGPEISNRLGWIIMELPSFAIILYFYLNFEQSTYAAMLSILWLIHYLNRTFIFPFRIRTKGKKMPLTIALSAIFFNLVNAGMNGYYLAEYETYTAAAFTNWNFYLGLTLFVLGFLSNQISDSILINLRQPGETGYNIPKGFLFNYISCPNHFSEIIQWSGFALMAWNLPATCFFIWTMANLLPRALKHHKWYKEKFTDYPAERKAVIPKLW